MLIDTTTLTEEGAINLFHDLKYQFGWSGTIFTRADADADFQNQRDDLSFDHIPDEVWDAIVNTRTWNRELPDRMCEIGWDILTEAVSEAIDIVGL